MPDAAKVDQPLSGSPGSSSVNFAPLAAMLKRQQFNSTATPTELISQLQLLSEMDALHTAKQKFWKRLAIIAAVGFALSVPLVLFALDSRVLTPVVAGLICLPLLFFLITATCLYIRNRRFNFPDRRHRIPEQLVQYLKIDMPPDAQISLGLDFRNYYQRRFKNGGTQGGFFSRIKQKQYEVPWLKMSGQLCDGTKFRLSIVQAVKRKEKSKRKTTKVTETFRDKYSLSMAIKPSRYPGLAKFESLVGTVKPPQDLGIPTAQVTGNRVIMRSMSRPIRKTSAISSRVDPDSFSDAHAAIQMFLVGYHCLGQCRNI